MNSIAQDSRLKMAQAHRVVPSKKIVAARMGQGIRFRPPPSAPLGPQSSGGIAFCRLDYCRHHSAAGSDAVATGAP